MSDKPAPIEIQGDHSQLWALVVITYSQNVLRAGEARVLNLCLSGALPPLIVGLGKADAEVMAALPEDLRDGLGLLGAITLDQYDAYSYVTPLSLLVYYVTLFDTLLQDTVEFLLCLHPNAIGDSQVPFCAILKADSRDDVLNMAIKNKVREIGFLSFSERLQWLRKRFGLEVDLGEATRTELLHYADVRNTVVHDQGYFDFCLDGQGRIAVRRRGCPRHPTIITYDNVAAAKRAFSDAAAAVAEAVFGQVLKTEPPEGLSGILKTLRTLHA